MRMLLFVFLSDLARMRVFLPISLPRVVRLQAQVSRGLRDLGEGFGEARGLVGSSSCLRLVCGSALQARGLCLAW